MLLAGTFAALILSFGYVALQSVQAGERRLLSIESELSVARRMQLGSLPGAVPPLERVRVAAATRVESNGLLFGVVEDEDYPTREMPVEAGDRFLLYTDGLTEPENASGEPFGDARLEEVLRECRSATAEELSRRLLAEVAAWRPRSVPPQDDITVLVVDVLDG